MNYVATTLPCSYPQEYAWHGLNFSLYCVGIFILVGAGCMAYEWYKHWNKKDD